MASEIWSGSSLKGRLSPSSDIFVVLPWVQVSIQGINNNMSSYIKIKAQGGCGTASMEPNMALHFALSWKVRSKLGDPDNTDEAARFEGMKDDESTVGP